VRPAGAGQTRPSGGRGERTRPPGRAERRSEGRLGATRPGQGWPDRSGRPTSGGEEAAAGGWEGEERYLDIYHIGKPNPNKGLGDVLID
jgi:hypothetical protein